MRQSVDRDANESLPSTKSSSLSFRQHYRDGANPSCRHIAATQDGDPLKCRDADWRQVVAVGCLTGALIFNRKLGSLATCEPGLNYACGRTGLFGQSWVTRLE
jgi:hypothetical protein